MSSICIWVKFGYEDCFRKIACFYNMYILVYMDTISTTIKKWGNSQGLRISKNLLEQVNLKQGDKIKITANENSLMISPEINKNKILIKKLLSKISDNNKVSVVNWGKPVGKEIW